MVSSADRDIMKPVAWVTSQVNRKLIGNKKSSVFHEVYKNKFLFNKK